MLPSNHFNASFDGVGLFSQTKSGTAEDDFVNGSKEHHFVEGWSLEVREWRRGRIRTRADSPVMW